jgi:hypothetical protein
LIIIVVAGHHASGIANGREPQRSDVGHLPGIKLVLYFTSDLQLGLEAFTLLLDNEQALHVVRHLIEGDREFTHLVDPLPGYAMAEVTLHDVQGSDVELVNGSGDSASERDSNNESDNFGEQEKHCDGEE